MLVNMKKKLISLLFAGLVIAGAVTFFLISQKDESKVAVIPEQKEVSNDTVGDKQLEVIRKGTFNYLDPLHFGEGNVEIVDRGENYKIKMSSNFKSADAPDPYIYLSSSQDFKDRAVNGVDTSKTINLGKLKSFSGEQEYFVSKSDFESHDAAVIVWCKKFGIQISRADLK